MMVVSPCHQSPPPYLGIGARLALSLILSTFIFVYARNWLRELRGK